MPLRVLHLCFGRNGAVKVCPRPSTAACIVLRPPGEHKVLEDTDTALVVARAHNLERRTRRDLSAGLETAGQAVDALSHVRVAQLVHGGGPRPAA